MISADNLFLLYLKLTLFSFDENDNAIACLKNFSVIKSNSLIIFEITRINSAFLIADALGKIETNFSLSFDYSYPVDPHRVVQSKALPDSIFFTVEGWNHLKLNNLKNKILDFERFL